MKIFALTAVALLLACAAHAAGNAPVCLRIIDIKNTNSPDPHTILFHMRDGSTWKNTLPHPCNGLQFNGFSYNTSIDKICSNLQSIRVNQNGNVCMLGAFTPYAPPPAGQ